MTARARPVLVYDGDCAFCTSSVHVLERIGPTAEIVAWQQTDLGALGLTEEAASAAVRWVDIDGTVRSGHEAIAAALGSAGGIWALSGRALLAPGLAPVAAGIYRLTAANRHRLPGGTPACATGPRETRRRTSRSIFARRLALSLPLALAVAWICSPSRKRSSTRESTQERRQRAGVNPRLGRFRHRPAGTAEPVRGIDPSSKEEIRCPPS